MHKIKAIIIFPIHFSLQMINLGFWATLIFVLGLIKLVIPVPPVRRVLSFITDSFAVNFGAISVFFIETFNRINIDIRITGELSKNKWYLITANHRSYLDVILMIAFAQGRVPSPKFFLKKELIWLPFVGIGAWALDMPFMKRYSKEYLAKHPEKKGTDIATTRKKCERYAQTPTTVINFVEGTRFTPEKHQAKKSPYQYLLRPKAAGIAFALAAMGEQFHNILDVSILYPGNVEHPMMDMLCGRMKRIAIDVRVLPVEEHLIGDYFNDETFRHSFQHWLNTTWQQKDERIKQFLTST